MNKNFFIGFGILCLLVVSVSALTVVQLRKGVYNVTFGDNRSGIVSNITFNRQANTLSLNVNMVDGKGMTMGEIKEAHDWADTQNGVVGQASTATISIAWKPVTLT